MTSEPRFWGDMGENGEKEVGWEFEDYEEGWDGLIFGGVATGEFLRGLVWGAGDRPMAGAAGLSFLRRPCGDLVKNLETFLRWRSMIL